MNLKAWKIIPDTLGLCIIPILLLILVSWIYIDVILFFENCTQRILFTLFFFFTPILPIIFFRYETRFVRRIDRDMNINIDDTEQIIFLKQISNDYSSRIPYLFSKGFNSQIVVANYLAPAFFLCLVGISVNLIYIAYLGSLFIVFWILVHGVLKEIYASISLKKSFFSTLSYLVLVITIVFIGGGILAIPFGLAETIKNFSFLSGFKDFFLPNVLFNGEYFNLAIVSFTLAGVVLAFSAFLKFGSKYRVDLKNKLEVYRKNLNEKYKKHYEDTKERNFSNFLLKYLNTKEDKPQIENISEIQSILSLKNSIPRYFLLFMIIGFLFLFILPSIASEVNSLMSESGQLLTAQSEDLTLDMLIFLLFILYLLMFAVDGYENLKTLLKE